MGLEWSNSNNRFSHPWCCRAGKLWVIVGQGRSEPLLGNPWMLNTLKYPSETCQNPWFWYWIYWIYSFWRPLRSIEHGEDCFLSVLLHMFWLWRAGAPYKWIPCNFSSRFPRPLLVNSLRGCVQGAVRSASWCGTWHLRLQSTCRLQGGHGAISHERSRISSKGLVLIVSYWIYDLIHLWIDL